jgi:hypothetical protein
MKGNALIAGFMLAATGGCHDCPVCDVGDVQWAEVQSVRLVRKTFCEEDDLECESALVDETTYDLEKKEIRQRTTEGGAELSGSVPSGRLRNDLETEISGDELLRRVACANSCEPSAHNPQTTDTLFITMKNREISMRITGCDDKEEPGIAMVRDGLLSDLSGFLDP